MTRSTGTQLDTLRTSYTRSVHEAAYGLDEGTLILHAVRRREQGMMSKLELGLRIACDGSKGRSRVLVVYED